MSLRTRMGLVAGAAVALSIVAVASIVYAGTRSELRGQVDRALQARADHRGDVCLDPGPVARKIARANAAYTPALFSSLTKSSLTAPPTDFNLSGAGQSISTNANFNTQGGVQQNLRWHGAGYSVSFSGSTLQL